MTHSSTSLKKTPALSGITLAVLLGVFKVISVADDAGAKISEGETGTSTFHVVAPGLDAYSALWNRSVFTSQVSPPPAPAPESPPPGWSSDFQLSGWVRLNGRLSVYLTRLRNLETIILRENEPASQDMPTLLCLSGEETILNARARVAMNGQSAWIPMNPEAFEQIDGPAKKQQPSENLGSSPNTPEGVVEPTAVDSRAAKLTGPVLLDGAATYQSITSSEGVSTTDNYQRLQNRREQLIRAFPRQPAP